MAEVIWLETCACPHCKGRAAVCMDSFKWVDKHAREDLLTYFDRLPPQVKAALLTADVNVCSWCAEIWVAQYGAASAARLIRDVRFADDARAVTPLDGWARYTQEAAAQAVVQIQEHSCARKAVAKAS